MAIGAFSRRAVPRMHMGTVLIAKWDDSLCIFSPLLVPLTLTLAAVLLAQFGCFFSCGARSAASWSSILFPQAPNQTAGTTLSVFSWFSVDKQVL